jgi:hypothetical protein
MNPLRNITTYSLLILSAAVFGSCSKNAANEQDQQPEKVIFHDYISEDSVTKNGYTLIFTNNSPDFASEAGNKVKARMIDAFFNVYPREAAAYNPKTLTKVYFLIDPSYSGAAETDAGHVRYNPKWMLNTPTDLDVVTHEVMHIVQGYTGNNPGWLVEGIADFARNKFGVDNATAGWSLAVFNPDKNYTDSYQYTARFLVWLEKNVKPNLVKDLDAACRDNTYTAQIWEKLTGKTVDELWSAYAAEPYL